MDVDVSNVKSYTFPGVELYPLQNHPVDLFLPPGAPDPPTFADKPFTIDNRAYLQD